MAGTGTPGTVRYARQSSVSQAGSLAGQNSQPLRSNYHRLQQPPGSHYRRFQSGFPIDFNRFSDQNAAVLLAQNTAAATRKVVNEMHIRWLLLLTGERSPHGPHLCPVP